MNGIISACLIGLPCRYNQEAKPNAKMMSRLDQGDITWIPVCPEQLGGLTTPRPASEIRGERVVTTTGNDVTECFERGADMVCQIAELYQVQVAVLKDGSPSCGSTRVYDGTFSGKSISGVGITTKKLVETGVQVYSEDNYIVD